MATKTATHEPILVRARAVLGLDELDQLSDRVSIALLERGADHGSDQRAATNTAVEAILRGDPIPADLGEDVARARREAERHSAAVEILREAQRQLPDTFRAHYRAHGDQALAVIRAEIDGILDHARPAFGALGSTLDADTAIDRDLADVWRDARRLGTRYGEARYAQSLIVSAALDTTRDGSAHPGDGVSTRGALLVDYFGSIDQPWSHYPGLVAQFDQQLNQLRSGATGERVDDVLGRPVGTPTHRLPWAVSGDPFASLRWITTSEAVAVVPDLDQLVALDREARDQAQSAGYTRHPHQAPEVWERRVQSAPAPSMLDKVIGA